MPIGRLHVLTDFHFQQRLPHGTLAKAACEGGADVIQFRQKTGLLRHKLHNLREVVAVCRTHHATALVDDHLDLALATEADGVHLGQMDLPPSDARRVMKCVNGPTRLLGVTATTTEQALDAEAEGADYIGFGPVFSTGSKANPAAVKGLRGLAAAAAAVSIPVIAIGGITAARVGEVLGAGAYGVAVMSAVTRVSNPARATEAFRAAVERASPTPPPPERNLELTPRV